MIRFDDAVDEYLHVIVRTRPWTKKSEEEALEAFGEWLRGEAGDDVPLTRRIREDADRYIVQVDLSPRERAGIEMSLDGLLAWAAGTGLIRDA